MAGEKAKSFAEYKADGANWITLSTGDFYPDILPLACEMYKPVLITFGRLLKAAHSSSDLIMAIADVGEQGMRTQLCRVFKKYVSPDTPVEMLKKKSAAQKICDDFGKAFRKIADVQRNFASRPIPDEALCALLWEYKDRGRKGYDLTERFFAIVKGHFPKIKIIGPERAGKDILMGKVFRNYPKPDRPVDFIIFDKGVPAVIGLARYDGDRGGAQEDDRTGGYRDCAQEILGYSKKAGINLKVAFLNDGPGLLLGSMWNDYSYLETKWPGKVMVLTLRMVAERLTRKWIRS